MQELQLSLFDPNKAKIIQSNQFGNARYRLSVQENRMLKLVISQIEPYSQNFRPYMVYLNHLEAITESKHKFTAAECKTFAENLIGTYCEIPPEDRGRREMGGWVRASLFSSIEYLPEERAFEVLLDPKLEKYFLQLKESFTSYGLLYATRPSSFNSQRLYEMIRQQSYRGYALLNIDELKESLMLEKKYQNYGDLEKRVIYQAKKEFDEKCDITFTMPVEKIRKGKRVQQIKLNLVHNYAVVPKDNSIFKTNEDDSLIDELNKLGIAQKQARRIIKEVDQDQIRKKIDYVKAQFSKGLIKTNLSGYLYKVLTSDSLIGLENLKSEQKMVDVELYDAKRKNKEQDQKLIIELQDKFCALWDHEIQMFRKKQNFEQDFESDLWLGLEKLIKDHALSFKDLYGDLWINNSVNMESEKYEEVVYSFVSEKLGGFCERFKKWAYEEHGYVLKDNRRTSSRFVIESRQELLI
jgi:plasmid replication initiation protein